MKTLKTNALLLTALVAVGQNAAIFAVGEGEQKAAWYKRAWNSTTGAVRTPIVTGKAAFTASQKKDRKLRTDNSYGLYTGAAVLGAGTAVYGAAKGLRWGYSKLPNFRSTGDQPADKDGKKIVKVANKEKASINDDQILTSPKFIAYLKNEKKLSRVDSMTSEHKKQYLEVYKAKYLGSGLKDKAKKLVNGAANQAVKVVKAAKAGAGAGAMAMLKTPFSWVKTGLNYVTTKPYNAVFNYSDKYGKYAARGGLGALVTASVVGLGFIGKKSWNNDGVVKHPVKSAKDRFNKALTWLPTTKKAESVEQPEVKQTDKQQQVEQQQEVKQTDKQQQVEQPAVSFVAQNADKDDKKQATREQLAKLNKECSEIQTAGKELQKQLTATEKAIKAEQAKEADQAKLAQKKDRKNPTDALSHEQLADNAKARRDALEKQRVQLAKQVKAQADAQNAKDAQIAEILRETVVSYVDRAKAGKERVAGLFTISEKTEDKQVTDEQQEKTAEDNNQKVVEEAK